MAERHDVVVRFDGSLGERGWRARCKPCDWEGEVRPTKGRAESDGYVHLGIDNGSVR